MSSGWEDVCFECFEKEIFISFRKLQFDRLYQETSDNVKIIAISVHPYLTGVPHRIIFFEKLLDYILEHNDVEVMTGRDIHDWYTNQVKK